MIEAKNLSKLYQMGRKKLYAVKEVSFDLKRGEIFALVGESGCGKSTLGKMLLGVIPPTQGEVRFEGKKVIKNLPTQMQMIFQDPFGSLNPRMTIGDILKEPLKIHQRTLTKLNELLDLVGLDLHVQGRFPHELSGGQRQRVAVARALALHPDFIVCDEPIAALDVSIQAQIVNLLLRLKEEFHLTYFFISHDLSMVRYIATRVAVMYRGEFVECAPSAALYKRPSHPYTKLLLSSIPKLDGNTNTPPIFLSRSFSTLEKGCLFATRCPYAKPICCREKPLLKERESGHFVACHFSAPHFSHTQG